MILAFDLGGTRLKAGVVEDGRVRELREQPSPAGAAAIEVMSALGADLLGGLRPAGVGLAVPGLVADGEVVSLPGKLDGLAGLDLAKGLREAFEVEATVVNDAIAYGVGEARAGAGAGYERAVVMTIGTGIGVAVLQAGEPVTPGMLGGGILGGQIPIGEDGEDTAGNGGTIEALCRAERLAGRGGFASVEALYAACAAGQEAAARAVDGYRDDLARALVALAHAHAPNVIVVGGGPVTPRAPILEGLEEQVRAALFPGYTLDVRAARLGGAAALVGLASLCTRGPGTRGPGAR